MKNPEQLESLDDIDMLVRGDVILARYDYHDFNLKLKQQNIDLVFHKKNNFGFYEFLELIEWPIAILKEYSSRKNNLRLEQGVLIFSERGEITRKFLHDKYSDEFRETLRLAGYNVEELVKLNEARSLKNDKR